MSGIVRFGFGLKDFKLDFVVNLVEERVGLGVSQFSESIFERLCSVNAS